MFKYFKKFRELIIEENDLMDVLRVVNLNFGYLDGSVGNCGWRDEPTKWFITFYANNKKYGRLMNDLNKLGYFKLTVNEQGKTYVDFERNKPIEEVLES